MNRRQFIGHSLALSAAVGFSLSFVSRALAAGTSMSRAVVNVMLLGGADLRFLFAPPPGTAYADAFWAARSSLYQNTAANAALYPDYLAVWNALYSPDNTTSPQLGIHNEAGWLKAQFDAGNVAIVCNTIGSDNRRHDQSQLIVNAGDRTAAQYVYDRAGWGGKLAYQIGTGNVVALTNDISVFCNGTDSQNRNARVVHAKDTRAFGLSAGDGVPGSASTALGRGLKSYYAAKQTAAATAPANWPFRKFLQHEASLRSVGDSFSARLATDSPVEPPALSALHQAGSGNTLADPYFGQQCAGLFDSSIAADLFRLRVASLEYTGWDTHTDLKPRFESRIRDIFGTGKGLDTLTQQLEPLGANDNLVYVFTTDFGRQLAANGDGGTDHGRGNYMIVVGRGVTGGIYGDPFPASELARFSLQGSDIAGLTSFEHVLARVCDWVEPGTGDKVFPPADRGGIEPGVDLSKLLV